MGLAQRMAGAPRPGAMLIQLNDCDDDVKIMNDSRFLA